MALSDRNEFLTALDRLPLLSRMAFGAAILIAKWQRRSSTRHSLKKLDRHMLRDIGVDPYEAYQESHKRFWQD
jgi:uncharacterized protein YjiS (DUF1127 family)